MLSLAAGNISSTLRSIILETLDEKELRMFCKHNNSFLARCFMGC
jgi:hypothetical protein